MKKGDTSIISISHRPLGQWTFWTEKLKMNFESVESQIAHYEHILDLAVKLKDEKIRESWIRKQFAYMGCECVSPKDFEAREYASNWVRPNPEYYEEKMRGR